MRAIDFLATTVYVASWASSCLFDCFEISLFRDVTAHYASLVSGARTDFHFYQPGPFRVWPRSLLSDVAEVQLVSQEQGLCDSSDAAWCATTSGAIESVRDEVGRSRQKIVRNLISERDIFGVSVVSFPTATLPNTSSNNQGSVGDAHFSVIAIDTICLEIAFDVLMQGLEFCKNIGLRLSCISRVISSGTRRLEMSPCASHQHVLVTSSC